MIMMMMMMMVMVIRCGYGVERVMQCDGDGGSGVVVKMMV